MRHLTAVALATLSLNCFAIDPTITGFTGTYEAPNGHGTATQFSLPASNKQKVEVTVEAHGEGYVLATPDGEWIWENPAAWVKDLKQATWTNVDVVLGGTSQRAIIDNLNAVHEDKRINLVGLNASCSGAANLLASCLNGSGSVRLSRVQYESALRHDQFRDVLRALARALNAPGRADDVTVKNLKLDISNNKFKGEVYIISATVKFEGLIRYSESDGKISIRLDKAKALFVDVRGKIFDELEKVQSDSLIVERPWIHILSE